MESRGFWTLKKKYFSKFLYFGMILEGNRAQHYGAIFKEKRNPEFIRGLNKDYAFSRSFLIELFQFFLFGVNQLIKQTSFKYSDLLIKNSIKRLNTSQAM